jgi:SRSO17 transposase
VPKEIAFKTKPEIALEQIEAACRAGLRRGVVLMDAGMTAMDLRISVSASSVAGSAVSQTAKLASLGELAIPAKPVRRGRLSMLAALVSEFVSVTDEPKFNALVWEPKA